MLKINRLYLILLLILVVEASLYAQQSPIKFERLSIEQGLSQSTVACIYQDRQGFMWFGTEDGLNKYDGYSFTIYKHKPQDSTSLYSKHIRTIFEDHMGTLWVGTSEGLNRYDPKSQTFTVFRHDPNSPNSISNNRVVSIYQEHGGTLWVGTSEGLNRYDPKSQKFTAFRHDPNNPNSISNNYIVAIYEDSAKALWVGTSEGLNRYDPKSQKFTAFHHDPNNPNSLSSNIIRGICEDNTKALWVGTSEGLNRYDPKSQIFTVFRHDPNNPNSISSNIIRAIYKDHMGTLWIATDGGLNKYDSKNQTFIGFHHEPNNPNSISSNFVWSIYEDSAKTLWIGTNGGGINKYDPISQLFTTIRHNPNDSNSISSNLILSIYEDSTKMLWIGTHSYGLNRYDPKSQTFTVFRHDPNNPNSISNDNIFSICEDKLGMLWVATDEGLNRYDPKSQTFTVFRHDPNNPNSISSNRILPIYKNHTDTLWIGTTSGGLNKYDSTNQRFTSFQNDPNNPNSITSNDIRAIYEDSNKTLWVCTSNGLNRYDSQSQTFTGFRNDPSNPFSISNNFVSSICEDLTGTLWIGTSGGLNKYDAKSQTFTALTEKDGLANDTIYGILEDKEGNLWLSTNSGISKFNPKTAKFRNYDVSDGLQSNEFNGFAYYKSRSGEMFFGGINGLNRFYPEKIKDNPFIPPIVITSFKIFDQLAEREKLAIATGLMGDVPLKLSYTENFLSFEFAALNFTHSEKNQYLYKLEGVDNDWVNNGTQRYARYTNLNAGEYIFRVKGSNNNGVWNETSATIKIVISPPPWRTWWAYMLYFFSLTGLTYSVYRYRLNTLEKHYQTEKAIEVGKKNKELEVNNQKLAEQKEKLAEQNIALIESHQRADRIFSALAEALPGTVLDGKYQLDEKIGSGGFGVVFRATHLAMKRPIAIKIFKPMPGNDSDEALERFQLEAKSACRIDHPNTVTVLDSGISTDGIAYLVMELLQGHTLTKELKARGHLTLERTAQILVAVCDVMAKAHSLGIVHRDIKPDNIFIHKNSEGEIIKLIDFGIAKLIQSSESLDIQVLTATGGIIGTPVYMAPERFQGKSYNERSDIYSLGIMLYEMLSGKQPFQVTSKDIFELVNSRLNKKPISLKEQLPSISPEVEKVVMQALAMSAKERPTAKELATGFLKATGLDTDKLKSLSCTTLDLDEQEHGLLPTVIKTPVAIERLREVERLFYSLLEAKSDKQDELIDQVCNSTTLIMKSTVKDLIKDDKKQGGLISPERWKQIERVFYDVIECEADKQCAFLDQACVGDPSLRRRVEQLIRDDQEVNSI